MVTDASRALPEFGEVEISSLPDGTTFEDIKSLQSLYREHCEVSLFKHSRTHAKFCQATC